jgi:hypothetical protein
MVSRSEANSMRACQMRRCHQTTSHILVHPIRPITLIRKLQHSTTTIRIIVPYLLPLGVALQLRRHPAPIRNRKATLTEKT